jgi:hypothetical protein
VFDVLRREPASFAPPAGADDLRSRARRRTRSQVLGGGALGVAVLAVAVGLAGGGTTEASQELLPAAPAVTAPAPSSPAPALVPGPSASVPAPAAPSTAPAAAAPVKKATPTATAKGSATSPARPAPSRPAAPSTPSPASPVPTAPAPSPSAAALDPGRHQVRVVAAGWDDTGRYLLLDLGDVVWGEPVEPGVDSTAPLLWESGPVQERLRVDLAEAYDLQFAHAGDTSSYGPGGWDDLVVEVDTRRLIGVVTVDAAGRVSAFQEPYRP